MLAKPPGANASAHCASSARWPNAPVVRSRPWRNAALEALDRAGIPWRIALTTPSLAGLRAAARSGLGVSVRTSKWLEPDLRILGEADGFPTPPDVELALLTGKARSPATARLLTSVKEALKP